MPPRAPRQQSQGMGGGARIPETLQTVMIMSNRGREVHKPPPQNVASKNFSKSPSVRGGGMFRRSLNKDTSRKSLAPIPITATSAQHQVSPHAYVTSILKVRGYCTEESRALQTAYYNKPILEQKSSYGRLVVNAVRDGDVNTLRELFDLGVSPNACNQHCESIVHAACRLGKVESLRLMLEYGCRVSVCDDYGRTPLHDACWARNVSFEVVEMLLEKDPHLIYVADTRGATPLSYVSKDNWTEWTRFFMAKKDKFWPQRDIAKEGFTSPPELAILPPDAKPIVARNRNLLHSELIEMVAEGSMDPGDATVQRMKREPTSDLTCEESFSIDDDASSDSHDEKCTEMDISNDDEEYDDGESSNDSEESDKDSLCTFDEEEMADILSSIGSMRPIAWTSQSNFA